MEDGIDSPTFIVSDIPKDKKIKFTKLFNININELLDNLRNSGEVKKILKIAEAKDIYAKLIELGISFSVAPDIVKKYPDILSCKKIQF